MLEERLGDAASFLGWLEGEDLARAYASAEVFLFPSSTDTFGQVILEAQASGLPVIAVAAGGPLSLIEHRAPGCCARRTRALSRPTRCLSSRLLPQLPGRALSAGRALTEVSANAHGSALASVLPTATGWRSRPAS